MSSYELESLGRILAGILRHFPEKFGLDMDEEGFVDIYKMVSAIKRKRGDRMRWLRPTHIIGLVETDPKGRYQVDSNHVRATYGHSIELSMSLPTDNIPERLYYPSDPGEVDQLLKNGLHPVDRTMVHLSKTWNDAYEAGIHREGPDPVIIRIDAEGAQNNGIIIQRAGKTVFTVEEIPSDFLSLSDEVDIELSRKEMMERGIDLDEKVPEKEKETSDPDEPSDDDDLDVEEGDLTDKDADLLEDDETDEDLEFEDDDITDDDLDIEEDGSDK
ncbi:MAG: RNA 2'-phosphotransferase [Candidatus Thermoplasmatota archaeon]|nr:RNA 2'-phosphotransferase [Candidatus Thermoplasmatota archaeon]